jgi:hypothetical protein
VICLSAGAYVAAATTAARASTVDLVVRYSCTGGIATSGSGTVNLRTRVTIPTTLAVGDRLNIGWALNYTNDGTRFGSPDYFAAGGRVTATGTVALSGGWNGELKPTGVADQPDALQPGIPLALPALISDSAATDRAAEVRVKPRTIVVDFTPPASEVTVNDDDPRVLYTGTWTDSGDRPAQYKDIHNDVHGTTTAGDSATFTFSGTGVDLIGELDFRAGQVGVLIDGVPAAPSVIDQSKDESGTPVTLANDGGHTLLKLRGLAYKQHTLKLTNLEDGKWAIIDAFKVSTRELANPPQTYRAVCTPIDNVNPVIITIGDANGGGSSPPVTPTGSSTGSTTPTNSSSATPSVSGTQTSTATATYTPLSGALVTATTTASSTPRTTRTAEVTVTASPQVVVTPVGGAQTGDAPDPSRTPPALLGGGAIMVFGGATGGLLLRRRRARHGTA